MAAVLVGPVITVTVPNELLLNTVPSIILPITKTIPVITVHVITNIKLTNPDGINKNKVVGIKAKHIIIIAILYNHNYINRPFKNQYDLIFTYNIYSY